LGDWTGVKEDENRIQFEKKKEKGERLDKETRHRRRRKVERRATVFPSRTTLARTASKAGWLTEL
jgi:hypothetical protein